MELQPSALVLNGRYRIERLLGAGGSGEVYLVTQASFLQGQAALKILRRGEAGVDTVKIENYRARFELEGRLQSELGTSPGIVRVFDGGDHEGSPVLVMDYMSGGTLKQENVAAAGKGQPWQRCADVLRESATGLQTLHARGYVHRDVKPSNILLDAHGQAKIADLGVVQTELTRTRTDGLSFDHPCSPGYCSPEHAVGTAALSPAADVYALGVIGFEMLTGHLPQPSALDQLIEPIGGEVPDWFKALITRMLAYDYRKRPRDGGAVSDEMIRERELERDREIQRASRAGVLREWIERALAGQSLTQAILDEAMDWADELMTVAPIDPVVFDLNRRLIKAMREVPFQKVAPLLSPIPAKPYDATARMEQMRREALLREDLEAAEAERRWADVARIAEELLELAPDDDQAMKAAKAAMRDRVKREREDAQQESVLRQIDDDRMALVIGPGIEMVFVRVPEGDFLMGSDQSTDGDALDDELPQHSLHLGEYWIGKSPVTCGQFSTFEKANAALARPTSKVADRTELPVVNVTWDDCVAFCAWASKLGGGIVGLPNEAEWEKAARGTEGRIYPWGEGAPGRARLNFAKNEKGPTAVGKYGAKGRSPYGCDDMAGNVWEWTRSLYKSYPYAPADGRESMKSRELRVLRGGSFDILARFSRCASRFGNPPDDLGADVGFRVCLWLPAR